MSDVSDKRIALVAGCVLVLDQLTKALVERFLSFQGPPTVIIEGFFKFVHWGNTGAAWSLFQDSNTALAFVSVVALIALYLFRHHFEADTRTGQIALGLVFGGILGNLIDRIFRSHVIDFLYFYVNRSGKGELGFPAFNIADSAICSGVALVFLLSLRRDSPTRSQELPPSQNQV